MVVRGGRGTIVIVSEPPFFIVPDYRTDNEELRCVRCEVEREYPDFQVFFQFLSKQTGDGHFYIYYYYYSLPLLRNDRSKHEIVCSIDVALTIVTYNIFIKYNNN